MKKIFYALSAVVLITALLCGCSQAPAAESAAETTAETTANEQLTELSGKYNATVIDYAGTEFPPEELLGESGYLELTADGKGSLKMGAPVSELSWDIAGDTIIIKCEGSTSIGAVFDDIIVVGNILGSGLNITYALEGSDVTEHGRVLCADGNIGDFHLEFTGSSPTKTRSEGDAIAVYYDLTNNSENVITPVTAISMKAYQDGQEIPFEVAYLNTDAYVRGLLRVRPGATINCEKHWAFNPEGGPVTVEAFSAEGDRFHCTTGTFDPAALTGATQEPWLPTPVTDPDFCDGLSSEGDLDNFHVKVLGLDTLKDYDGLNKVIMHMEISNNADEAFYPIEKISFGIYQDNIQLMESSTYIGTEEEDHLNTQLEAGETRKIDYVATLRNNNTVEYEIGSYDSSAKLGGKYAIDTAKLEEESTASEDASEAESEEAPEE